MAMGLPAGIPATYVCTDEVFLGHKPLGEHPERPERLSASGPLVRSSYHADGQVEIIRSLRARAAQPAVGPAPSVTA